MVKRCEETIVIDEIRVKCARIEHETGSHSWIKDGTRFSEVVNGESQPNTKGIYN
jgi:hypothetical protein